MNLNSFDYLQPIVEHAFTRKSVLEAFAKAAKEVNRF